MDAVQKKHEVILEFFAKKLTTLPIMVMVANKTDAEEISKFTTLADLRSRALREFGFRFCVGTSALNQAGIEPLKNLIVKLVGGIFYFHRS